MLSTKNFPAKLSRRSRFCHVCKYELQNDVLGGVVACTTHGVRLCTKIHPPRNLDQRTCLVKLDNTPVTDWSWTCQTTDSCWNKFHTFYALKGLFKTRPLTSITKNITWARCDMGNELYQLWYEALGIPVPTGKKKGKVDINLHRQKVDSPNNIHNDDDDDNEDSASSSY